MSTAARPSGATVELWMISNVAAGAAVGSFIVLLIPPFVTQVSGSAASAGIAMALISLAAITGPLIGSFADQYRAHTLVYLLSLLGLVVAFALYALGARNDALHVLDALILGVAAAGQGTIGLSFIVGAGLDPTLQARQLTSYSLLYPAGQLVGGALLAAAAALGYAPRFWLAAGFCAVCLVVTWLALAPPVARLHAALYGAGSGRVGPGGAPAAVSPDLRHVLMSTFGLYLLVIGLSSITSNGISSQLANIMPQVFGYSATATATLVSLVGLVTLVATVGAGLLLARVGALTVYTMGTVLRLIGALGLAVLGISGDRPLLAGVFAIVVLGLGGAVARLGQPQLALGLARVPASAATGFLYGATALGAFVGALVGGVAAAVLGYNQVNWLGAIAAAVALGLVVLGLAPAYRKRAAASAAAPATPPDAGG